MVISMLDFNPDLAMHFHAVRRQVLLYLIVNGVKLIAKNSMFLTIRLIIFLRFNSTWDRNIIRKIAMRYAEAKWYKYTLVDQ